MYSQNREEEYILKYFGGRTGTLLDIGANDGKTFSNSLKLIQNGWAALLIEPSDSAFHLLSELHAGNEKVTCLQLAIGSHNGLQTFQESGPHLKDNSDTALLSTLKPEETERWRKHNVSFIEKEIRVTTYESLMQWATPNKFDFITIDAEGMDMEILKQIDLSHTSLICIEWNSIAPVAEEIIRYAGSYGLNNMVYQSGENLIIGR